MKKEIKFIGFVMMICFVAFSANLFAEGEDQEKPKKEAKPKPEVKDIEVSGVVEKVSKGEGKPNAFTVKTSDGQAVTLPTKMDGKEIDLDQYVGKEVIAKGKGTTVTKKNKDGAEVNLVRFVKLTSVDVKAAAEEKKE